MRIYLQVVYLLSRYHILPSSKMTNKISHDFDMCLVENSL